MPKPPITRTDRGEQDFLRRMMRDRQEWVGRPDGPVVVRAGGETQRWVNRHTKQETRRVGADVHRRRPRLFIQEFERAMEREYA